MNLYLAAIDISFSPFSLLPILAHLAAPVFSNPRQQPSRHDIKESSCLVVQIPFLFDYSIELDMVQSSPKKRSGDTDTASAKKVPRHKMQHQHGLSLADEAVQRRYRHNQNSNLQTFSFHSLILFDFLSLNLVQ